MDSDDSVLVKKCGAGDGIFQSSGNTMKVKFHSDYSVEKRGFKAAWRQIPGIMAEDIITSNNFPQNYQDNFDQVTPIEKEDSIKDNLYQLSLLLNLLTSELATQGTGSRRED